MRKTKEILYTARNTSADEAEKLGLVNKVVDVDDLEEEVRALEADISKTPVEQLMISKKSTNNFYENMNLERSTRQIRVPNSTKARWSCPCLNWSATKG